MLLNIIDVGWLPLTAHRQKAIKLLALSKLLIMLAVSAIRFAVAIAAVICIEFHSLLLKL